MHDVPSRTRGNAACPHQSMPGNRSLSGDSHGGERKRRWECLEDVNNSACEGEWSMDYGESKIFNHARRRLDKELVHVISMEGKGQEEEEEEEEVVPWNVSSSHIPIRHSLCSQDEEEEEEEEDRDGFQEDLMDPPSQYVSSRYRGSLYSPGANRELPILQHLPVIEKQISRLASRDEWDTEDSFYELRGGAEGGLRRVSSICSNSSSSSTSSSSSSIFRRSSIFAKYKSKELLSGSSSMMKLGQHEVESMAN